MQVGSDTIPLQLNGLIRAAASNNGERRAILTYDLKLRLAKLERDEAQDANSPGAFAHACLRFLQQRLDLWGAQQRERQKRQRPLAHRFTESGHVTDPRHWPLQDGIARTVGDCKRALLAERACLLC